MWREGKEDKAVFIVVSVVGGNGNKSKTMVGHQTGYEKSGNSGGGNGTGRGTVVVVVWVWWWRWLYKN